MKFGFFMRMVKAYSIALLSIIVFQASGQGSPEFNSLLRNSNYILLVKLLNKPCAGNDSRQPCEVWVEVVKDYKGNFSKAKSANENDSIPVFVNRENVLLNDIQQHEEYIVLLTGTSIYSVSGLYYQATDDNSIGRRAGPHDRDGFVIGGSTISYRDFMNGIESANNRERITHNMDVTLEKYRPASANEFGFKLVCRGRSRDGVYADGVYYCFWKSTRCQGGDIFIYESGKIEVLAGMKDDLIIQRVEKFLKKNKSKEADVGDCLTEVRDVLRNEQEDCGS